MCSFQGKLALRFRRHAPPSFIDIGSSLGRARYRVGQLRSVRPSLRGILKEYFYARQVLLASRDYVFIQVGSREPACRLTRVVRGVVSWVFTAPVNDFNVTGVFYCSLQERDFSCFFNRTSEWFRHYLACDKLIPRLLLDLVAA